MILDETKCPFCNLKVETELYYEDSKIWIVRDSDKKKFDLRILGVWKEHVEWLPFASSQALKTAMKIFIRETFSMNYDTVEFKVGKHAYKDHAHFQAGLKLKGERNESIPK